MKALFTICCIFSLSLQTILAQPATLEAVPGAVSTTVQPSSKAPRIEDRSLDRRVNGKVVTDTVLLPTARRSSQRGIILNTVGSATGACQFYAAPQPITLTGFEFYAYKDDNTIPTPAVMKCEVYEAGGQLPVGSPLYTTTVNVPYSSTSTLANIRIPVTFANPITVNSDYVLTVELMGTNPVVIASNNWDTHDGDGDYYAGGILSGTWLSGSSISVSGVPFDADFFIQPYVKYTIKNGLGVSTSCLHGNDTISFSNTSSPVFRSKFYNKLAFLDTSLSSTFRWNFGDGSPVFNGFKPDPHVYSTLQKYTITKRDSLLQWTLGDKKSLTEQEKLDQPPMADFTFSGFRNITFHNQSVGIDKVKWIFTDSTYSTLVDPVYYFFGEGNYNVTLIVENGCGSDTITKVVQIAPIGIQKSNTVDLNLYPNPASNQILLSGNALTKTEGLELVDLTGRVIMQKAVGGLDHLSLDVTTLARGWYLLKGEGPDISFSRPVVLR